MANIQTQTAMYLLVGLDEALRPRSEGYDWKNSPGGMVEATMWIEEEFAPQVILQATTRNVNPDTDMYLPSWLYVICEGIGHSLGDWIVANNRWPEAHEIETDVIAPCMGEWMQKEADEYRADVA